MEGQSRRSAGAAARRLGSPLGAAAVSLCLLLPAGGAALAQSGPPIGLTTPDTLRPPSRPGGAAFRLPRSAPADVPEGADQLFVTLAGVAVEGAFAELAAETDALAASLAGRRVTAAIFYELAARIEALHAHAGYVFARVVIPPQEVVDGGTLRIVVVDGFIEAVDASALPERARRPVERRIAPLIGKRRVNIREVERRLLLAEDLPGVSIRSALSAGREPGGTLLTLEGGHDPVSGSVFLDNGQSETAGGYGLNAQVALDNALGLGEQLYASGALPARPDHVFGRNPLRAVIGIGAVIPLGIGGFEINPEYTWSRSEPLVPEGGLATISRLQRFSLRASHPVIRSRAQNLRVFAAFNVVNSSQEVPLFGLDLYEERLRVLRAGLEWDRTLPWGASLTASATASKGLDLFGTRTPADVAASGVPLSRFAADPTFEKVELEIAYRQALPLGFTGVLVGRAQHAFGNGLPDSEQFDLTGGRGLSAFMPGSLAGDAGYSLRAELGRAFPLRAGTVSGQLAPYAYGAVGGAALRFPTLFEAASTTAVSYGIGLRAGLLAARAGIGASLNLEFGQGRLDGMRAGERLALSLGVTF